MGWGFQYRFAHVASLLVALSISASAQQALDLDGRSIQPLSEDPEKVVVLVFLRRDCPVSGRYAPSIQQISGRYADVAKFWLVYPDKNETVPEIRESVDQYGYHLPVLRDPEHALV